MNKLDQSPGWGLVVYSYIGWFLCGLSVFIMQFVFADMMSSLMGYWCTVPFIYYYLTVSYYRKYPDELPLYVGCLFLGIMLVTDLIIIIPLFGGFGWSRYMASSPVGQDILKSWFWPRFTTGTLIPFFAIPITTYITGNRCQRKSIKSESTENEMSNAG